MGKSVKVLKSGLFVSLNIPILGSSLDAKIIDLSCRQIWNRGSEMPILTSHQQMLVMSLASLWRKMGSPP